MRIKNLLVLALTLFCAVMAQAQVVKEDFSAPQTKAATDQGYYEFINLHPAEGEATEGVTADKWTVGEGVLSIENSADFPACNNQKWQRAIKFRNLPLKEKTFYKLSFDLKTTGTYVDAETSTEAPGYVDMKIMQGDENADICIQGADGSEQRANFSLASGDNKNYSKVFYFADLAKQNAAYEAACAGKENYAPSKFFAGINVYTAGSYVLDNVVLQEATAQEATVNRVGYNGYNLVIFYNDKINASALLAGKSRYIFDPSCVTVTVNGKEAEIEGVEIQSDGNLYIFLEEDELTAEDVVKVTFHAPAELQFTGSFAGVSPSFADITAVEDKENVDGDASSFAFAPAEIVSSVPENNSFALPTTIEKLVFTFDHEIDPDGGLVAEVSNGTNLKVESIEGKVVTLKGGEFPKGSYTVTLKNVKNKGYDTSTEVSISFETGEIKMAETVYTDLFTTLCDGDNNACPTGWTVWVNGENWAGGEQKTDFGSNCRNINVTGSDSVTYSAFYLCDRDKYTYMKYGDQEGYNITLPAGNIEFSVIAVGHEAAARTVDFRLEDVNGNEILSTEGQTTVQAENFTTIAAAGTISGKFNNPTQQNVILKIHEPEGGYTACRVLGFKARSYVETPGEKYEAEVVAQGSFASTESDYIPAHGTGWKIYRDAKTMRDPGANANWGGNDWTGGGGPRVKHPGNKGFNGGAIYLADATYATYGEYLYQTNHTGQLDPAVEEKTLDLKANQQYQITYYIMGWKPESVNSAMTFGIYNQAEGVSGTPLYTRTDEPINADNVKVNSGSGSDASKEAVRVQFYWTPTADGKYALKFTSTDESLVGNITVETVASLAAQWYSKLQTAVNDAKTELATSESEDLDGTAKTNLVNMIAKYEKPSGMYTQAAFEAAIAEVNAATKAMQTRRETMTGYNSVMSNIATLLEAIEAAPKYKGLACYTVLVETYNKYASVEGKSLENDELVAVTAILQNSYDLTNNMYKTGVKLLTKQTDDLAASLKKLDESKASDASVLKAGLSIKDDQDLAYILKLKNLKAIYDACAAGDPFSKFDPELQTESVDSLDLSGFIQNANLYSTCITKTLTDTKGISGWNFPIKSGDVGQQWSWSTWNGSETNPVNDVFLLNGWNGDFMIEQNVSLLPVGSYRYVSGTQDRGFVDTSADKTAALSTRDHWTVTGTDGTNDITGEIFSYIYWQSGEVRDSLPYDISAQGQWYGLTNDVSKEIAVNATGSNPYGDLLIGTRAISYKSSASVDNFKIYMIGKKEGFDYAAAAKAVQKLIDELQGVNPDVNGDGKTDKLDVDAVVAVICGGTEYQATADVDGDGKVNVIDVNLVINAICNPKTEE